MLHKYLQTMSLRYWNTAYERRELNTIAATTCCLYMSTDIYDPTSDSDTEDEEDETSIGLPLLFTLATLAKHTVVFTPIEDASIEFGRRLTIEDFNESQCIMYFRFRKEHLKDVAKALWPKLALEGRYDSILCANRYRCPFETALLILLYRFSRPVRLRPEMEEFFGMRIAHLSNVVCTMVNAMYDLSLPYFSNPGIFAHKMEMYSQRIYDKNGVLQNIWGFIDGTLRKTARPLYFQRHAYSGHKRCHGLKFQTVVTPDGLIACMWGPMNGNRHDSHMLRESSLLEQLQELMPVNGNIYSLYGDPAYPQSQVLFGGYWHPAPGSIEAHWNTLMSKVREAVEWGYCLIIQNWKFLDLKSSMKVFEVPVAKYYTVGAFLTNIKTTFYDNQINVYFKCETMRLDEYLNLVE